MASRDLNKLSSRIRPKADAFFASCKQAAHDGVGEENFEVICICTERSKAEQIALYAQKRKTLEEVNALRRAAGMMPITEKENKKKVTDATWSQTKHVRKDGADGVDAFDFAILQGGKLNWDAESDVWKLVVQIGRDCGLKMGADFKRLKDSPHAEV